MDYKKVLAELVRFQEFSAELIRESDKRAQYLDALHELLKATLLRAGPSVSPALAEYYRLSELFGAACAAHKLFCVETHKKLALHQAELCKGFAKVG